MDIGQAVEKMRQGQMVGRPGWNGKGMFLFMCDGDVLRKGLGPGPEGCDPFVVMKTAPGTMIPWNCSQADLLATDWEVIA